MVDQRGGMRNAATTTKASSTKGMSRIVVTPPGGAENTQAVMASIAKPISIISMAGPPAPNAGVRESALPSP